MLPLLLVHISLFLGILEVNQFVYVLMDFGFVSADLLGESLFGVFKLLDVELEDYQGI